MESKAEIAERVVEAILCRRIQPGERLGEQEIADLFGVSRTLVREALMTLKARGFVTVRPRSGWYVAEPSFDEAIETYAARRVIETGMLRDAGRPLQSVIRSLRQHVADEREVIANADAGTRSVSPEASVMFASERSLRMACGRSIASLPPPRRRNVTPRA